MRNILLARGHVTVSLPEKPFDPKHFFRNRVDGFIHSHRFHQLFLSNCMEDVDAKEARLAFFDLSRPADDDLIKDELPKSSGSIALWQIAYLLKNQWNGEDGPLLCGESDYNVYYSGTHTLSVGYGLPRGWGIGVPRMWEVGLGLWPRTTRIFAIA